MRVQLQQKMSLHQSLLVPTLLLATCLIAHAAVDGSAAVEVKIIFPGLHQKAFDARYGNRTRGAIAFSAGVPESYVTWVNMPRPAAGNGPAVAAAAAASGNSTKPATAAIPAPVSTNASVAVGRESAESKAASNAPTVTLEPAVVAPSAAATAAKLTAVDEAPAAAAAPVRDESETVSSSSSSRGARRLLAPAATTATAPAAATTAAAAAAAGEEGDIEGAVGLYRITTDVEESWATPQAVADKLQMSVVPPGYTFLANLRRRGVPYDPVMYVNGAAILQGRTTPSDSFQSAVPQTAALTPAEDTAAQPAEQTGWNVLKSLPLGVLLPILVLSALLIVLLLVGTCVLACFGIRTLQRHRRELREEKERGQFIKNGDGSDSGSEGLTRAPAGGYAPTETALAQLNASFPSPTGGSVKSPASVTSADVRSVTTAFTTATTVRSTAGLMAAQDGKKGRVAKNSSNSVNDDDMSYIRQYQKEGKPVPIPHSRLIRPGSSSIKVPRPGSTTSSSVAGSKAV